MPLIPVKTEKHFHLINMKGKSFGLFLGMFLSIIGITILRQYISDQPYLILLFSVLISLAIGIASFFYNKQKKQGLIGEEKPILMSSLINEKKAQKILTIVYKLCQKNNLPMPHISVFKHQEKIAYSYQIIGKANISLSTSLIDSYNHKSLRGILAHELAHIKNNDSWNNLLRLIRWTFVLSVAFFFLKNSVVYIFPFIMLYEFIYMRQIEYDSDQMATQLSSPQDVLNCLIDSYILKEQERENIVLKIKNKSLKEKFKNVLELLNFDISSLIVNHIGSHPQWQRRILMVLDHQGIKIKDKEFNLFLKKMTLLRKQHKKTQLDLSSL